jgi:predicted small secreted protein
MKRIAYVAIAILALAFGVGACKKAHDAGNDSMNAGHSSISAANGQSDAVRATALAGSSAAATGIQKSSP